MILLNPLSQKRMEELRIAALVGSAPPDDWYDILTELLAENSLIVEENADLKRENKSLNNAIARQSREMREADKELDELRRRVKS